MEGLRNLLLSNLNLPESVYVNVENKKDFHVLHQTVEGGVDTKRYSLVSIRNFITDFPNRSATNIYHLLHSLDYTGNHQRIPRRM